jgi:hypothetical protein
MPKPAALAPGTKIVDRVLLAGVTHFTPKTHEQTRVAGALLVENGWQPVVLTLVFTPHYTRRGRANYDYHKESAIALSGVESTSNIALEYAKRRLPAIVR